MDIREIEAGDQAAVDQFLSRIPKGDRTFFKENVDDPAIRAAWFRPGSARLVAADGEVVIGYVAVVPLPDWSSHVGEVSVIVDPAHRGRGIGRALARRAVIEALKLGLTKMVIEVVADQEAAIAMFRSLGFVPEALLKDHIRDHSGHLRDLMVLAHAVDESWGGLEASGVTEAL
jgi:L-amino acid N-acyltransferase YncA